MALQVLDLGQHVVLRDQAQLLLLRRLTMIPHDSVLGLRRVAHPLLHRRQPVRLFRVEQALHDSAVGMSADDDQRHLQHQHCVLDTRRNATYKFAVMRHKISRVTLDEEIARPGLREQIGNNARIGAGDEHRDGLLPALQARELLALSRIDLGLKLLHTFHDFR